MATRPDKTPVQDEQKSQEQSSSQQSGRTAPAYLQAALRVSTSRPLGAPRVDTRTFEGFGTLDSGSTPGTAPVPGVMCIDYLGTYGASKSNTSALNRAAFNEFNFIRSQISGNRPYEPVDHMVYRACVDSMREMYHCMRRIYAIVRGYSATNLYRPSTILTAMNLNANDWISNAAALYQWLLTHQSALQPFPTVPIGSISDRHVEFDTYLFTDGEPECAQTYILNHRYFYSYKYVDEVKGMSVVEFPATFAEAIALWDEMYNALQTSSDVYIIAADIRRAFGDRVVTDLPATPIDAVVEYRKMDSVLTSIMNASIIGMDVLSYLNGYFRIQDNGEGGLKVADLDSRPVHLPFSATEGWVPVPCHFNHINCIEAAPSEGTVLAATRFMSNILMANPTIGEGEYLAELKVNSFGTEVLTSARIAGFTETGALLVYPFASGMLVNDAGGNYNVVWRLAQFVGMLSNFDWHPPVALINAKGGYTGIESFNVLEDTQNYVPVTDADLAQIQDAVLLAEFGF